MQKRTSNSKYVKALIKLVCPDNDGRSRIFYPKEFVGEFECLSHNNGCNWARQARKIFKLKINHENNTKNGDVVSYQLKGFQTDFHFNDAVAQYIRKYFSTLKGKRSAWSGIPCDKDYEIDHNKGVKNDPRISNPDTQLISDFQILTPSENKCKREMCLKCKSTAKRPKGSVIFPGCSIDYTYGGEKLEWDKSNQDWSKDACKGCCLNDIEQWRKDAEYLKVIQSSSRHMTDEEFKKFKDAHEMAQHDREVIMEHETKKAKLKYQDTESK